MSGAECSGRRIAWSGRRGSFLVKPQQRRYECDPKHTQPDEQRGRAEGVRKKSLAECDGPLVKEDPARSVHLGEFDR
jgi:hypothetical protein